MENPADTLVSRIRQRLFELKDEEYRDFNSKLIPTVDKNTVIGVRTPALRSLSAEIFSDPQCAEFLSNLPHKYYEENNLHAFIIERIKDYEECIVQLEKFLPYVDNWATCDLMAPKVFKKHLPELILKIKEWISSGEPYTVRFAIEQLMSFYLDDEFRKEYLSMVASVRSSEYYVNMMVAWYFATALAKQYVPTLSYIEGRRLEKWTHNKTIRKACESYRIMPEQKAFLKTLKIK